MPEDKFKFQNLKNAIIHMKDTLPTLLANDAKNYFSRSFLNQGWEGRAWPEVKRRIKGTQEWKYPKKKDLGRRTRPILVGKGSTKLRRAVANSARVEPQNWPVIRLVVDLPYAARHNEGLDGMPKRTFMADSKGIRVVITRRIKNEMKKLWQG